MGRSHTPRRLYQRMSEPYLMASLPSTPKPPHKAAFGPVPQLPPCHERYHRDYRQRQVHDESRVDSEPRDRCSSQPSQADGDADNCADGNRAPEYGCCLPSPGVPTAPELVWRTSPLNRSGHSDTSASGANLGGVQRAGRCTRNGGEPEELQVRSIVRGSGERNPSKITGDIDRLGVIHN